ncbi:hypothetical protein C5O80_06180 [Burkholderia sp. SRS-46]|nr:hypothetical protein C5O80_06180 [Burkholderia sp. SRS-46]
MNILSKIEGGYLQVLRVVVLLFATAMLVGGVAFGVIGLDAHLSKPPKGGDPGQVDTSSFSLEPAASSQAKTANPASHAGTEDGSRPTRLSEKLTTVLRKHGRAILSPNYAIERDAYVESYERVLGAIEHEPAAGFPEQQIDYLDKVLSRPDIAAGLKRKIAAHTDEAARERVFSSAVGDIMEDFAPRYTARQAELENEKKAAEAAAVENAQTARYAGAAALIALYSFVSLAVLIILIRVERSLRSIATATRTTP